MTLVVARKGDQLLIERREPGWLYGSVFKGDMEGPGTAKIGDPTTCIDL